MAKNGKAPKSKSIDSGRETRVLLEDISRDVTRIAEAQASSAVQIAELKTTVNELLPLKSEVKSISMAVMSLSGDVKTLQSDMKTVKNDVKTIDAKVDSIDTRLKAVENKVDENLANHEKRITKLEEKVLA